MHRVVVPFVLCLALLGCYSEAAAVRPRDVSRLTGEVWRGTLTYLDYQSGERTTIPSTLRVTPGEGDGAWTFAFGYADEPQADGATTIAITEDGAMIGDETVVERIERPDGSVRIVSEQQAEDNNRPAKLRFVYEISDEAFSITKLVRYEGEKEEFERNTFLWTR